LACEVDLQAFKPGNVSVYADGHGMTVDDFRISAKASAEAISRSDYSLGQKIYYAVKATREAVNFNTNLGIILLCAPLIQAANYVEKGIKLKNALLQVLSETTVDDANWVFNAITLASPGGLGHSDHEDVHNQANVNLQQAMQIASPKDRIALQYVTNYQDIFDFSITLYYNSRTRWGDPNWAGVAVYLALLSRFPDSHIERKYGNQYSEMVAAKMAMLNDELSKTDSPERIKSMFYRIDRELKSIGVNPGTTADLTVATVFTAFLEELFDNVQSYSKPS